MTEDKLTVKDVSHSYALDTGSMDVLTDVNMQINREEFVSLIGPSGCGKSTLFNIIAGVTEPVSGQITIDGIITDRLGRSGYMPQKPLLLPWQTLRQNVILGPTLQHSLSHKTEKTIDFLLKKFGLADYADQYPQVLSGGMAQKAALLRTITASQDLLLMDEPFGALDAITRQQMQLWLLEVWRDMRSTALLITHDIREAILLSDRIYVLSRRPATVIKEITVNLPRPRHIKSLTTDAALRLETALEKLLIIR